jgi:GTP-binding protein HflX
MDRTLILCPILKTEAVANPELRLLEAVGLAEALNLEIVNSEIVTLAKIIPGTFLGSGKVSDYQHLIQEQQITLVIIDAKISPIQQRNLEKAWNCKVIERKALILEIFASRARTREGKLQVELALLEYQKSRLVRSWTHLERQRGGFGFMGGPGEKQIETDRRLISEQIKKLKTDLEKIKNARAQHRKSRTVVPYPIVALVGYTNSGKTTLFNNLTGAKQLAADMLFATLDPTMRMVQLPSKRKFILSDTVGFISDLPTELVAAFRATLEEVIEADLILHVQDIASEEYLKQQADVNEIMESLLPKEKLQQNTILVKNKIDLLEEQAKQMLLAETENSEDQVALSSLTGENCNMLLELIEKRLAKDEEILDLKIDAANGKTLAWLYDHAIILNRTEQDHDILLKVQISEKNKARLQKETADHVAR